ncbi:MAG: AMP-binding protein [Pseudomonadota bacterium]
MVDLMDPHPFNRSLLPILTQAFDEHAVKRCLCFKEERFTYAEVGALSARVANRLISAGFRPGMKGAVYSLNSALSFIATLGIVRAGGVWIPINPRNSQQDNVAILKKFEVELVFFQRAFDHPVKEFASPSTQVVCLDSDNSDAPELRTWLEGVSDVVPQVSVLPTDLVTIPLTGGTTGLPKGVMLSHRNFCALEYGTRKMYDGREAGVMCAAPMTHVGGRIALCGLSSGVRFVILESVDPQLVLNTIQDEKITDTFLPPTGVYALLDQPKLAEFDLSSLRNFSYGSAPIATERLKEALRSIGPVMRGGFGQTECPMFISRLSPEEHFVDGVLGGEIMPDQRLRSVGRSTIISELGIVDEAGEEVPRGERGEIAVKGPMVSEGYFEAPEETAKIRVNGWHLTGDIGYMDEEGYLYVVDRKKDMIITGGFNVYSSEVEQGLMELSGVQLAVVFGVPDEKWGEAVSAHIKVEPGASINEEDVIVAAKAAMGGVKAPKVVTFVEDFPRTPVGKIDKKVLRDQAWANVGRVI